MRAAVAFGVLAAALTVGCGRKSQLRPPEDVKPAAITDLSASDAPAGIELAWGRPRFYVDHARMTDLGGFVIERAVGPGPDTPFVPLARFPVTDRERFRQIKRFRHLDTDTTVGTTYRYRVVSFTVDGYFSAPSNMVTIEHRAPTGTPGGEDTHAPLPTPQR